MAVVLTAPPRRQLDPERLGDHIDRLYRAAWAMCGSREEAEDLVQETFARVLRKPRWLSADNDVGYLLHTLRNVFRSTCRARSRRPLMAPLPANFDMLGDATAVDPHAHLDSVSLYAEIAGLPALFRDAVLAVDVVGLSYAEASRLLSVKEATLTTRLHRGRARLAQAVRIDPSS